VSDQSEVLQDLFVLDLEVDGSVVHVDVYGGPENACGSVHFSFENETERDRHVRTLRQWAETQVSVTLVVCGSRLALVNDRSLLSQFLRPAPS